MRVTGCLLVALTLVSCTKNPVVPDYEHGDAQCSDTLDNDANGLTDCADPGCVFATACQLRRDGGLDLRRPDVRRPDLGIPDWWPRRDGALPIKEHYFPASLQKDVDLLIMVDNSNSMEQEQKNLATNIPKLIDALAKLPGGMPNLHLGVVSSDLGAGNYSFSSCEVPGGDGGKLQGQAMLPGCIPPKDPWISYIGGVTNIPGTGDPLAQVRDGFACISQLGVGGCGFEQQLESVRRALDPSLNVNPGFLRPGALLAVLLVTDEDDCSAQKPQLYDPTQQALTDPLGPMTSFRCFEFGIQCDKNGRQTGVRQNCVPGFDWLHYVSGYVSFFKQLKPPGQVVLGAIAGPLTPQVQVGLEGANPVVKPSCMSINGSAVPAIRIKSVLDGVGTSMFSSVCDLDFGPALASFGTLVTSQLGTSCLQPLKDVDPLTAGLQVNCVVEDLLGGAKTPIPPCSAATGCGPCPCWRVVPRSECATLSGYSLEVSRAAPVPAGTIVSARCQGPDQP